MSHVGSIEQFIFLALADDLVFAWLFYGELGGCFGSVLRDSVEEYQNSSFIFSPLGKHFMCIRGRTTIDPSC